LKAGHNILVQSAGTKRGQPGISHGSSEPPYLVARQRLADGLLLAEHVVHEFPLDLAAQVEIESRSWKQ
jgi:hypothetical protein